jgi:hypothetical protein
MKKKGGGTNGKKLGSARQQFFSAKIVVSKNRKWFI